MGALVYSVGVDLAWGEKAPTGLCAVTANGRVLGSWSCRTLDEIVAWCEPYMLGDVIVPVDAPLVVPNPVGRRECERALSRCYGGRHAGPHSSNRSMPSFVNGGRARRLADRLGLDVDPLLVAGQPIRRMVEVYPHPAIVTLFGLETALAYKAKSNRTIEVRKTAFEKLFLGLEGLATAMPPLDVRTSPRWAYLRSAVTRTQSSAMLDRVEDELDAYVCAYIGLYYVTHGLARCRVVGDLTRGYIITPVTDVDAKRLDDLCR